MVVDYILQFERCKICNQEFAKNFTDNDKCFTCSIVEDGEVDNETDNIQHQNDESDT